MKLFQRLICFALCLAALCLTACGGTKAPAETPAPAQTETPAPAPAETPAPTAEPAPEAPAETPAPTEAPAAAWDPDLRFETVDMDGNTWTDACFAEHKLTVINLWAYWCGPCVAEMPDLQRISEEYADRGVQFLGLYDEGDEDGNRETVAELGITYPCLRNTPDFAVYMDTGYVPTTIFVDQNGKVEGPYVGGGEYEDWVGVIEELLP